MRNHVSLEGRLGRNPEIFMTPKGKQIAKISIPSSSVWKDEKGEWKQRISWHEIVIYRESTIGWIKDILKKGDLVQVEGRLAYHYWRDNYNQEHRKAQVVISDLYGTITLSTDKKSGRAHPILEKGKALDQKDLDSLPLKDIPFLSDQTAH